MRIYLSDPRGADRTGAVPRLGRLLCAIDDRLRRNLDDRAEIDLLNRLAGDGLPERDMRRRRAERDIANGVLIELQAGIDGRRREIGELQDRIRALDE